MACVLCFADNTKETTEFIQIFSEEGASLNICDIIKQHLWFEPEKEKALGQSLCWSCWVPLRDFHSFYCRVAELHLTDWKYPFTCSGQFQEKDPFPPEVLLKSEEFVDGEGDQDNSQISENLNKNPFDSEIKLEVHDLNRLPQIEIFELPPGARKRRGRPRKTANSNENEKCITETKGEKDEIPKFPTASYSESDNELPLSTLLVAAKCDDGGNLNNSGELAIFKTVEPQQKKRRGRPKKVKTDTSCRSENAENDEKHTSNVDSTKKKIKKEQKQPLEFYSDENDIDHNSFGDTLNETEDSDVSSTTDSEDNYEPKAQYAVITKKKVVKPKKYRKREKPIIPIKRMSREEIEARKAQQEEYEKVIKKFFVNIACPICELLVHNFQEIRDHLRSAHNIDPGYMLCCGRKFFQRKELADHIYVHWNPEHFKCKICNEICTSSRQLAEHEEAHNDPSKAKKQKTFQCDKCEKAFWSKAAMQEHFFAKHVPTSEYKFACPDCNKKFPTNSSLKHHKRKSHEPKSSVICDKCGKQVRSTYLRKHHSLEHSEVPRPIPEPQQCQICGTWLRHAAGLKQHMRTIHEDPGGEHRCQICNKVSTTARALKRHIYLNHECERKFKCTMCEKAFKRPQDLREHTSVHTGKVLYNCPNCPMTFFSSANMYKHRQRLHRAEYEADRKKPKHLLNIMAQSRGRLNSLPENGLVSDPTAGVSS